MILTGTEVRSTVLYFPWSSFAFLFLKMRVIFPLFQSAEASVDSHGFSNITDSGLATSSASSLRTCGCNSSGPLDDNLPYASFSFFSFLFFHSIAN